VLQKTIPSSSHIFSNGSRYSKILSKEYLFIIYIFFANNDVTRYVIVFVRHCVKMPFSTEDKYTIKVLREQKLRGATKILRMFPNKNWTLSGVQTVLSKVDATGSV